MHEDRPRAFYGAPDSGRAPGGGVRLGAWNAAREREREARERAEARLPLRWATLEGTRGTPAEGYLSGLAALNVPTDEPGGDWHPGWSTRTDTPAPALTDTGRALCRRGLAVLGLDGVRDVRGAFAALGHPEACDDTRPVWAAGHARAVADLALWWLVDGCLTGHHPCPQNTKRWCPGEQIRELEGYLERIERDQEVAHNANWRAWKRRVTNGRLERALEDEPPP